MMLSERLRVITPKITPERIIPFGEWLPDQPAFGNPGIITAKNVIAGINSYLPMKALDAQSPSTFNARVRGALAGTDSSGDTFLYVGTDTKLYEVRNATITDRSGTSYATAATSNWEAVRYDTKIIFTNFDDVPQSITVGADANFADHITSTDKPRMRHIAVIGEFLVGGYINDGALKANQVRWSALADSTDFDEDATTQADVQTLVDIAEVTKVVGGIEYGLVFAPDRIYRMTYVGSPLIFDFTPIDRQRGTTISGSVVSIGRRTFYITREGIAETDGTQSRMIGHNKVDNWFWDQFDTNNAHRVSAAIDFENENVVWSFPGADSVGGDPDQLLLYNYANDRFTYSDEAVHFVAGVQTQAYTLEQLDFALQASSGTTITNCVNASGLIRVTAASHGMATGQGTTISGVTGTTEANGTFFITKVDDNTFDLDGSTFSNAYVSGGTATPGDIDNYTEAKDSFDASKWKGGEFRLAGFASDLKPSYFTGANLEATIDTAEGQMVPGKRSFVEDVRPLVDGGAATVAVGHRELQTDTVAFTSAASQSSEGLTSHRKNSRYHRFRTVIPAGGSWNHAQGVEVTYRPKGRR